MSPETALDKPSTARGLRLPDLYPIMYFGALLRSSLRFWASRHTSRKILVHQVFFTGVEALGTIALISLGIGAIIIVQGIVLLPQFGAQSLMYRILILIITRELGPLLTAFIVAARSGSAITTELGNMVVSHEVEAYVASGISPINHLGVPRLLGVVLSTLTLTVYFNIFGLIGSYAVVQFFQQLPLDEYLTNLVTSFTTWDLLSPAIKCLSFGVIIGAVATYHGFKVERSVTEVPQQTIKSIAQSIVLCIVANILVTALSYVLGSG